MDEEPGTHLDLSDQTLLILNKINKIRDYFITEIRERETKINRFYNQSRRIHYNHKKEEKYRTLKEDIKMMKRQDLLGP